MRSIRRRLRGQSVLPKTQRNHAFLLRTRFTTIWRSEIHISLKIDTTPWTIAFVSGVQYIISIKDSEGSMLVSAYASTVYAVWRIKSKMKQILPTVFPTQPNLNSPNSFKLHNCLYYGKQRNRAFLVWTRFKTSWGSEIYINLKLDADALNRRRFYVRRNIHHIYQGQRRQYAGNCACVYGVCSVKNKIENETNLTDCTSNLT
jgi:hypothetical protein